MNFLKLVENLSLPIITYFNLQLMLKVWWNKIFTTYNHDVVCLKTPCISQQAKKKSSKSFKQITRRTIHETNTMKNIP